MLDRLLNLDNAEKLLKDELPVEKQAKNVICDIKKSVVNACKKRNIAEHEYTKARFLEDLQQNAKFKKLTRYIHILK